MAIDANSIDSTKINKSDTMNTYQAKINIDLALNGAKQIGIKLPGIDAQAFQNKIPKLILATLWGLIKQWLQKSISFEDIPELQRLQEGKEDLRKLNPDQILIKWINYHLRKGQVKRTVKNLGKDLQDSEALLYVLHRLNRKKCPINSLQNGN